MRLITLAATLALIGFTGCGEGSDTSTGQVGEPGASTRTIRIVTVDDQLGERGRLEPSAVEAEKGVIVEWLNETGEIQTVHSFSRDGKDLAILPQSISPDEAYSRQLSETGLYRYQVKSAQGDKLDGTIRVREGGADGSAEAEDDGTGENMGRRPTPSPT